MSDTEHCAPSDVARAERVTPTTPRADGQTGGRVGRAIGDDRSALPASDGRTPIATGAGTAGSPEVRARSGGSGGQRPPLARAAGASVHTKKKSEARTGAMGGNRRRGNAIKRRGQYSRRGYVFPPMTMNYWAWKAATADAIEREARTLSYGKTRRGLLRRATALRLCGTMTKARLCGGCETVREGSGIQCAPPKAFPCNARACALCSRRRAQKNRRNVAAVIAKVLRVDGYTFKHIVVQVGYDPRDPNEVTADALRERAKGVSAAMAGAWVHGLRRAGAGLQWGLEVAGAGFVHLHALYYGPFVPKGWLEAELRSTYPRIGHTWIETIPCDGEATAPLEVAKYICKSPSPLSECWLEGKAREVTHPVIAARWEVAMV